MQFQLNIPEPVEYTELSNGQSYIRGYFTRFYDGTPQTEYVTPNYTLRISPTALNKTPLDSAELRYNHNPDFVMGNKQTGLQLSVDNQGGYYQHPMDTTDPEFTRVAAKIKKGLIKGSSFKFLSKDKWTVENGTPIVTVEEVTEIEDIGPVNNPAIKGTGAPCVLSVDADAKAEEYKKLMAETQLLLNKYR